MLFACLDPQSQTCAAYMCETCEVRWSGIVAFSSEVSHSDILTFLACPVHGVDQTQVKVLDIRTISRKRK